MDIQVILDKHVSRLPHGIASRVFNAVKSIPFVRKAIEKELNAMMAEMEGSLKPYWEKVRAFSRLPESGMDKQKIIDLMDDIRSLEMSSWEDGYVSGAVYHGDQDHIAFLNQVYEFNSQSHPLHSDIWPSAAKFESEIVSMTADMLGAGKTKDEICGVGVFRRHGKHPAGHEDLPGPGPEGKEDYPAGDDRAGDGPRGV